MRSLLAAAIIATFIGVTTIAEAQTVGWTGTGTTISAPVPTNGIIFRPVVASEPNGNAYAVWDEKAPAGRPPTGYVLEGGLSPGSVLGSIATGNTATAFTFNPPSGVFFVRVHALSGNLRSAASNGIQLVVNAPVLPSAPAALLGLATGSKLALSWTNTFQAARPPPCS